MGVSYPTKLTLAFRSGDKCALCNIQLTPASDHGGPVNVGEAAHIAGEHDGKGKKQRSARYDEKMTDEERNSFSNLIYLCGTCHTKIDAIPQGELDYPTDLLLQIKSEHQKKVQQAMLEAFAEVGFAELEEATRWVMALTPQTVSQDYSLLRLEDKICKNNLTNESQVVIAMGLGVASEVSRYIESVAQIDPDFPERLTAGFLEEYHRLRKEGFTGDERFDHMCRFAQRGFDSQAKRSAGQAVLIYLFESCEVFEK